MKLYKFRKFDADGYHLDILKKHQIWFPSRLTLNDPFEGYSNIEIIDSDPVSDSFIVNLAKELAIKNGEAKTASEAELVVLNNISKNPTFFENTRQIVRNFRQGLERQRDELGIWSASSDKHLKSLAGEMVQAPQSPLGNMPMWAHYSDNFTGFCIEFDKDELLTSLNTLNGHYICEGAPVKYSNKPFTISAEHVKDPRKMSLEYFRSLEIKSEQWASENEFRIISTSLGGLNFSSKAITAIYFAENIAPNNKAKLVALHQQTTPHAPLFEVQVVRGIEDFYLQPVRVG